MSWREQHGVVKTVILSSFTINCCDEIKTHVIEINKFHKISFGIVAIDPSDKGDGSCIRKKLPIAPTTPHICYPFFVWGAKIRFISLLLTGRITFVTDTTDPLDPKNLRRTDICS